MFKNKLKLSTRAEQCNIQTTKRELFKIMLFALQLRHIRNYSFKMMMITEKKETWRKEKSGFEMTVNLII